MRHAIKGKSLLFGLVFLGVLTIGQSQARADEVHISGSTAGCFGAGCTPGAGASVAGLLYSNSTFSGTSANGFLGFGGNANPGANLNNVGSLTLAPSLLTNYTGQNFTLQVIFTAPQGITGSNQATFSATLTGNVRNNTQGGVFIDFNNTPLVFTFVDANCEPDPTGGVVGQQTTCGTGSFFFAVNDLSIFPGQTASLTGQITGAQQSTIPEPATLLLLGTGLAGIAAGVRRRMKTQKGTTES